MTTYEIKKWASIVVIACSVTACATDDDGYGYRNQGGVYQGGTYIEQRSYGSSYGGATWYREEVPNYDRNRNGIPDNREVDRNHNGIPNNREVDRNRNGVPDQREQDRNRNGIPDNREADRNRNGVPDRNEQDRNKDGRPDRPTNPNPNWNNGSNRQNQSDDKSRDGKAPDNRGNRPNNNWGNSNNDGR